MKKKVYEIVKEVLLENPSTRDSDKLLMFYVWSKQNNSGENLAFGSGDLVFGSRDFVHNFAHPKTIVESRRLLQREQEEKLAKGEYIPGNKILIASKKYQQLRQKLSMEKGTHIYREQVSLF